MRVEEESKERKNKLTTKDTKSTKERKKVGMMVEGCLDPGLRRDDGERPG